MSGQTTIHRSLGSPCWRGNEGTYLPQIEVVTIPRMMHGEYVMMHPKEFAAQALTFFDGTKTEEIEKENEGR